MRASKARAGRTEPTCTALEAYGGSPFKQFSTVFTLLQGGSRVREFRFARFLTRVCVLA